MKKYILVFACGVAAAVVIAIAAHFLQADAPLKEVAFASEASLSNEVASTPKASGEPDAASGGERRTGTTMEPDSPANGLGSLPQVEGWQSAARLEEHEAQFDRMLRTGMEGERAVIYGYLKVLHDKILSEPRNEAWASEAEARWMNFYAGKPEVFTLGDPKVYCRSTMCEVRLLVRGSLVGRDAMTLDQLMVKRGSMPHGCGTVKAIGRDDLNGDSAIVAMIDLSHKSCNPAGVNGFGGSD